MIFSTTPTLEGHPIREYRGVVTGETIIGANVFKDFRQACATSSAVAAVHTNVCCAKLRTQPCAKWQNVPKASAATPSSASTSTTKQ